MPFSKRKLCGLSVIKSHGMMKEHGRSPKKGGEDLMVILLAGGSHAGKTALAQKLLEQHGYPYISIDHLKMGLIRSGYTSLTPESSDRALTEYLWPVVREMIKTAIENKQNLIVEGCYIPFDWEKSFSPVYRKEILYRCLLFSEVYIRKHFQKIQDFASVVEERGKDEDCTLEAMLRDNAVLLQKCKTYGQPFVLIQSDYEKELGKAMLDISACLHHKREEDTRKGE